MKGTTASALALMFISTGLAQTNPPTLADASRQIETGWIVPNSIPGTNEISFNAFLNEVVAANLDYAAQRYSVSIAEAAIAASKQFPNPVLQLSGGHDVSHSGTEEMPSTFGSSLIQTIETGTKRKYRIRGARQSYAAAAATLDGFLRNLRLDASAAFANALALARNSEQKRQSAQYLSRLAEMQRERFRAGDISQVELLQTQVEEQRFQNELLTAEADAENASLALSGFLGRDRGQTRLIPKGNLELPSREFNLSKLLAEALQNRADLIALRHIRDAAESKILEEKANRIPNVDAGPSWTHSTRSENSIAPSPEFDSVGVSLSFPLPLWNRNKAAIASAYSSAGQAKEQLESAELKAEVQIRQTFGSYRSAVESVGRFQSGILKDAKAVLEANNFSYQRGQTTLLELLDAQRTANDVDSSYNQALADQAKALIELERAAQLWEIQF